MLGCVGARDGDCDGDMVPCEGGELGAKVGLDENGAAVACVGFKDVKVGSGVGL